jgi:hypothetical protein
MQTGAFAGKAELRKTPEERLEREPTLETGQPGAETVVDSVPERHVASSSPL